MTKNKEAEVLSFEQSINALEAIVEKLEGGQMELEQAIAAYEKGVQLAAHCNRILTECEGKITVINKKNNEESDFSGELSDVQG